MKNRIVACGLILLLVSFALFLRLSAISLPAVNKMARAEVYNKNFVKIKNAVNKKYSVLPQRKKDEIITRSNKSFVRHNKYLIEGEVREKTQEKKSFYRNKNAHTYLFGIDSYYWLRLIDNLINKGHIGDRIVDGRDYDDLVDMPIEQSLSRSGHLILGKFLYSIFGFFRLNVDYELGLYLIPLLFSVLLVIFTFLITKLLSKSNSAAFFATIAVNFSPLFLKRTMNEWLDTDIYSVFFPLIIFGAFLLVFKSTGNIRKTTGLACFALSCSIYASIWQGWWYIFDLLMLSGLVFVLNDYSSQDDDRALVKKNSLWLFLLFVSGLLFVGIFNGKESCFSFITEPYKLLFALKEVPMDNWPNVFLTVAELKKVTPYRIAFELGGVLLFFVTILGSIYLVIFKKIIRDRELGIGFFSLFIWLGVLYYTSLNAVRFALLLVVPLGIMFGIVFNIIIQYIFNFSLKLPKKLHFSVLGLLVFIIYLFVAISATRSTKIATFKFPLMNDSWYKTLEFIKDDTDERAIINSWWDYGHWFKAVAQRRVLFDGKTQNSPIAYWMARVLTTDDEMEAVGILRMLDISKNKAFDLLKSYGFAHVKAVNILFDIVRLSENEARQHLQEFMPKEKIDMFIPLVFSKDMPKAYFIASYDMLSKMRSISHIGNWDFNKGDIWMNLSKGKTVEFIRYMKEEHGYTKEKAVSLWNELSLLSDRDAPGWISEADIIDVRSLSTKFTRNGDLFIFGNGLIIDLSKSSAYIFKGPGTETSIPYSIVYMKDGVLKEDILENSNSENSVLLFKDDKDSYGNIFLDKDLAKSMFVRMYFFKGEGLEFFDKLLEEKTPEGNLIYTYGLNWPQ